MKRVLATLAFVALGAALACHSASARATPVRTLCPRLPLPALVSTHPSGASLAGKWARERRRRLGDYDLLGRRPRNATAAAELDASGGLLL